jgi:ribosomal protein L12E/L44/L45/RPP1/RPP2
MMTIKNILLSIVIASFALIIAGCGTDDTKATEAAKKIEEKKKEEKKKAVEVDKKKEERRS